MNTENDHDYFRAELIRQSGKATLYRLEHNESEIWLPNSLHEFNGQILEVEAWFAKQNGMQE